MSSTLEYNRIVGSVYPYSLNFATLFASHLSSILTLFFFISFFITINIHMTKNPLQIDLHLIILLPQFFYSRSCLIGIILTNSDFSTFQSFQSSLTIRKKSRFLVSICPFFHRQNLLLF